MKPLINNKKGIIWFLAIPIGIIGLVITYFIFKAILDLVITAIMYTIGIGFILLVGYVVWKLVQWSMQKKGGKKK